VLSYSYPSLPSPAPTPVHCPNEKLRGHICRTLLVWQLSSLFCIYVCFVSTTETICEVHVSLLLVCARVNGVVHNMHNVFTVCFIALSTVLEYASQCHTCVTVCTEHTETYVCMLHCKRMYSTMSAHVHSSAVHSTLIGYLPYLLTFC